MKTKLLISIFVLFEINKVYAQDFSLENHTISEFSAENDSLVEVQPAPLLNETGPAENITHLPTLKTNVTSEVSVEDNSSIDLEQPAPLQRNEAEIPAETFTYQIHSLETNVTSEFSAENDSLVEVQPAPLLNETEPAENITYHFPHDETMAEDKLSNYKIPDQVTVSIYTKIK